MCASSIASEQGRTQRMREDVVYVEVKLHQDADIVTRGMIDGNGRLDAELGVLAGPDQAGVDRSRRAAAAGIGRRLQAELHHRRQMADEIAEALVADIVLQIEQAVFQRAA